MEAFGHFLQIAAYLLLAMILSQTIWILIKRRMKRRDHRSQRNFARRIASDATTSLRMATTLQADATEVYKQLLGRNPKKC